MPEITESLSIDIIIDTALELCRELPETPEYLLHSKNIRDLRERLAGGRLRIAVLGQFNRGKSTFINALLGIEILPTSVLPITSVPTVISYGTVNQCTVSFSDGREDAVVEGEAQVICDHLTTYVTEQHNPRNRLCVSEAIVKCESQLLGHGTVIIDTPGFGSTHTHNTETTLDLLASCDAALFLLSADLPITQVEVDFLTSVLKTIPRLFFVYNKVDLLNKNELEVSEKFITDTLISTFGFTLGVRLFPVSAKMMARKLKDSEAFVKSGLAALEKEVIDFLLREKYFTLSEALTDKFQDALSRIVSSLEKNRDDINRPIIEMKEDLDTVLQLEKTANNEMSKTLSLSEVEETALYGYCERLAKKKRDDFHSLSQNRLRNLLASVAKTRQDTVIVTALEQLLEEMFSRLCIFFIMELNKPLRNAATAHLRELGKLAEKVEAGLDVPLDTERDFKSTAEDVEIDIITDWRPDTQLTLYPPKASFLERFAGPEKWQQDMFEHYSLQLLAVIDTGLEELSQYVNNLVASVLDRFVKKCISDYTSLTIIVKEKREEKEVLYKGAQEKAEPELEKLVSLIEGFVNVTEMVI